MSIKNINNRSKPMKKSPYSNVFLHPTATNPEIVRRVQRQTGLIAITTTGNNAQLINRRGIKC